MQSQEAAATFALAVFGSSAHKRNRRGFVSCERMSRLVNPREECSSSIRLLK